MTAMFTDHAMSWSLGPGPAAVEARWAAHWKRQRALAQQATERLWEDDWEPRHHDGRGPLALALGTAELYAAAMGAADTHRRHQEVRR